MTVGELAERYRAGQLEAFVDTRTAAHWLDVGYETMLADAASGHSTLGPIRVGGRIWRWPTLRLLAAMGVEP